MNTSTTTVGVKLSPEMRERLRRAAQGVDRTPHWIIRQLIHTFIERSEREESVEELLNFTIPRDNEAVAEVLDGYSDRLGQPFLEFAQAIHPQGTLRAAITAAYRRPEIEMVPMLLEQARLGADMAANANALAMRLAERLRSQKSAGGRTGLVQGLLQEFSLSSQEGVALMCLAEALLRIPDKGTRDALIRDKISSGNWSQHLGQSPSVFVNAASWGLLITGKLVSTHNEGGLTRTLNRVIAKSGEPLIRKAVDMAMRLMGEQFVTGETIAQALANATRLEGKGFRYSYDMLGEAALTDHDAKRYLASYEQAIHSIGKASHGRGIYEGPGISIKLSALHPRYSRAQCDRVMHELYPRLLSLTLLAKRYDIGLNVDAEEADRLELSLDLLERLCFEPQLAGWNGIGFVIQAYQKRCPYVIDAVIDLARRSRHRLMIRLVKGAYWDSEIKRAQVEGLEGYPVYTRKVYTDVSYLACARKLLAAPEAVYPQFATHNAHTLSAIYQIAGQNYYPGQYEFQCLHGMGEPLYEQVVGSLADGKLGRPCRIYAPVGTHETLLAYLVRRLLENGANTSFVNRVADHSLSIQELVADPVVVVEQLGLQEGRVGLPHPRIAAPVDLYGDARKNSAGIDLSNEHRLASLSSALLATAQVAWEAAPILGCDVESGIRQPVLNPADLRDVVGQVQEAVDVDVENALRCAVDAAPIWQSTPAPERAAILQRAADMMEAQMQPLMGLLTREAGKTYANGIAEVREAVDFLRYYAVQAARELHNDTHRPLGPVVCISPWNFPLAIFTGQVAAALAAGNPVLAKPAEQTPLIAAQAVRILLEAGIPSGIVQLLPGDGVRVGARLVDDSRVRAVMFTGSTEVARIIQRSLAGRLDPQGRTLPLIAETGGQNAMIVDSSALTEQVVMDVVASAFDSAGQRCSALRVLCVQEDVADRVLEMLKGAMAEYHVGNPERLSVDIGPVIDGGARQMIENHISRLRSQGCRVYHGSRLDRDCQHGTFVQPTVIELDSFDALEREVFGPVLHVIRYAREDLPALMEQIRATGYGLTLGLHTRIDETIAAVIDAGHAGNIYVNRNMVGAVVGVQPFGGEGLSGTGPKAGGPLYLLRLLSTCPVDAASKTLAQEDLHGQAQTSLREQLQKPLHELMAWAQGKAADALPAIKSYADHAQSGTSRQLPGPTGERNSYAILPRQRVLGLAGQADDLLLQLAATLSVGAHMVWVESNGEARALFHRLPRSLQAHIELCNDWVSADFDAVIHHGDSDHLRAVCEAVAERPGAIVGVQGLASGDAGICLERLVIERAISINTAAAGGNASLMSIG
ncbi:trifunctional transcriptional regulator/proline dehydrogenase/L-glutamate gamma-semialdehyde dehydrogenase [Pseudomonas sp. DCB_AW]|uniref:trifunctional transcriptional regulator/proline dehydrogenase/L-glutamate gamma-semialdehyde dehydrogenase n=1 Tax=Pseudomonas sp. DCB_AW TaxID=2993596 RepID=UPI002248D6FB|nr:trifunctional transcriptional regulator/proline dehydrogenase/L-glutamate gamma-semialdehyde dehydrogenase [Pseudomonas sp. DCB_AW]MCX2684711.1 trifunctional transcriptional regulator/proline dehydrogenase/L-glutamate gamma-semialdehyde dehydrogenase [Pseudomonas sp. DCB_AW]